MFNDSSDEMQLLRLMIRKEAANSSNKTKEATKLYDVDSVSFDKMIK